MKQDLEQALLLVYGLVFLLCPFGLIMLVFYKKTLLKIAGAAMTLTGIMMFAMPLHVLRWLYEAGILGDP